MPKVKFLVDENVDFQIVLYLRGKGFDVVSIAEDSPSIGDIIILEKAAEQQRIIVTNDKDFGLLVFKEKVKCIGVILFRLYDQSFQCKINVLDSLMQHHGNRLEGNFIVLTGDKVRIRRLD